MFSDTLTLYHCVIGAGVGLKDEHSQENHCSKEYDTCHDVDGHDIVIRRPMGPNPFTRRHDKFLGSTAF